MSAVIFLVFVPSHLIPAVPMKTVITMVSLAVIGCGGTLVTQPPRSTAPSKSNYYYDRSYEHGKKSYHAGLKPSDNPYISNGSDAAAWLDGWMAASKEKKGE